MSEQTVTLEAELAHAISNGPAAITPDLLQRAREEIARLRAEPKRMTEARDSQRETADAETAADIIARARIDAACGDEAFVVPGYVFHDALVTHITAEIASLREELQQLSRVISPAHWEELSRLDLVSLAAERRSRSE